MKNFTLQDGQRMGIEMRDEKLRLVVYRNGVENVCRMESAKKLEEFIQNSESQLFRGRLRLYKQGDIITVVVKGKIAGTASVEAFCDLLPKSI